VGLAVLLGRAVLWGLAVLLPPAGLRDAGLPGTGADRAAGTHLVLLRQSSGLLPQRSILPEPLATSAGRAASCCTRRAALELASVLR